MNRAYHVPPTHAAYYCNDRVTISRPSLRSTGAGHTDSMADPSSPDSEHAFWRPADRTYVLARKVEQMFWQRVAVRDRDDCWLWLAGTSATYGMFYDRKRGRMVQAHRYAYEVIYTVWLPSTITVDHLCCTRLCCNPSHLRLMTQSSNVARANRHPYQTSVPIDVEDAIWYTPRR